ncbi:auxin-induced protein 6B-like [Salvia divinorum]|uniref:Auxin-induced protein 6B-like n=1 Tax=Salvia divinorum TaxID=28513 RepID=A0ABD1IE33_SALDI
MNKVIGITQIVRLRQVVRSWKTRSLMTRFSEEPDGPNWHTPPGSVAVYVGLEHSRFVVPTRFLNYPAFVALLDQAEEEFGYQADGAISLPCETGFFRHVINLLEKDEKKFSSLELREFVEMF